MSEWWTYTLSDFLLFSPRTYYRMLELYNLAVWPAQVAGIAIGCAVIALLFGKHRWRGRIIAGLLAACWLWIGWAFHYQRYAQINWAAPWFAAAFAIQALLLVVLGVLAGRLVFRPPVGREGWLAITLAVFAILLYPLLAPLSGRAWMTAETFGVAADPTAIATVAVLARVHGGVRWLLVLIPLCWCAIAAATLWTMEAQDALVVAGAALLALLLAARDPVEGGRAVIR
jgi:Family of unknown function (DUF6064)